MCQYATWNELMFSLPLLFSFKTGSVIVIHFSSINNKNIICIQLKILEKVDANPGQKSGKLEFYHRAKTHKLEYGRNRYTARIPQVPFTVL